MNKYEVFIKGYESGPIFTCFYFKLQSETCLNKHEACARFL